MPDRGSFPGRVVPRARLALLVLVLSLASGAARAAETQWWVLDRAAQHARSELAGVVVRPEGVLELGPRAAVTADDSLGTIWAIAPLRDGSYALASDRGRISRWTESGGIRPWLRLPVGQVLSLAVDGDALLAGTGPEGLVYRIGARGDTSVFARTGERYVWALAPAGRGAWFAATGTLGRVLRLAGGRAEIALDTEESNLVAMIPDGANGVYLGGDSKGRVLHLREDGTARTLFDAPEDEIRALARGADGALYAAALSASAVAGAAAAPPAPAPAAGAAAATGEDDAEGGITVSATGEASGPAPSRSSEGRASVYRIVPDSAAALHWSAPQPVVYALAPTAGGVLAATGNRAGVYLISRPQGALQWLAASQGQITALHVERSGRVLAATSNPAAIWRLGPGRADRGTLSSPVLDARRIARFGRVVWHGAAGGGRVALRTRTGNTDPPDTTWTSWAAVREGGAIASPPGRYLQWQLELQGGAPQVESVETSWREQNLPPTIEEVVVAPQATGFREGDLLPRTEPVTQTLPTGAKVEFSMGSPGTPRALRELPSWVRGLRTVQWKGADPNGDPLRYTLEVGASLDGPWTAVADELENPAYTWDSRTLPDGRYRLRVTATDVRGNAVGEERTAQAFSEPFQIDNTPPAVTAFTAAAAPGAVRIEGAARDETSPLTRIEVSVDDGPWRVVTPDGGFADDRDLRFRATWPGLAPGEHRVGVRVVDLAGNSATRATRVRVTAGR